MNNLKLIWNGLKGNLFPNEFVGFPQHKKCNIKSHKKFNKNEYQR